MADPSLSRWTRFWHEPVRAERLAITRIFLGLALLTDQLCQYLPYFEELWGPEGVGARGVLDESSLSLWRWTVLLFTTENRTLLYLAFGVWVTLTVLFIVGWHTRTVNVLLWFVTLCFINRNLLLRTYADSVLMAGLFLLMFAQSGRAFALDALHRPRQTGPPTAEAWPLRLLQIQLCIIYLSTGLAKLGGEEEALTGTWWYGTSIHYTLNCTTMSRWSYAQLPLPLWVTAPATYLSLGWEVFFPLLVLWRRTRKWALWFGVLFHLGIWLTIEVGWFSFYMLALYGVWIPDEFWDRFARGRCPK
jgi:hypothetical protein